MNTQTTDVVDNPLNSDNLQELLLTIRSKIFSIEAKDIEETVDGTTTINNQYKEYDIEGKLHESYTAPYEVNQQDVNINIGVGYNSDKYVVNANYKHTRKGNTIKLVSLGSTQVCLGRNSAHRVGVLGTSSVFKALIILGAAVKVTALGVSLYVRHKLRSAVLGMYFVGVYKEVCKLNKHMRQNHTTISIDKTFTTINRKGRVNGPNGPNTTMFY